MVTRYVICPFGLKHTLRSNYQFILFSGVGYTGEIMRRTITIIIFATAALLAGCRGRTALDPTPFPTIGPTVTQQGAGPVVLTVTELISAPASIEMPSFR